MAKGKEFFHSSHDFFSVSLFCIFFLTKSLYWSERNRYKDKIQVTVLFLKNIGITRGLFSDRFPITLNNTEKNNVGEAGSN